MPVSKERFERGEKRYSIEHAIIQYLHENPERAYNVHEITVDVLEPGWSKTSFDSEAGFEAYVDCVLDLATVSSILDALVDDGVLERRILDRGEVERSYYRTSSTDATPTERNG